MAPRADAVLRVETYGQTCPQPLTATTLALRRARPGQRVEVVGDHPSSFREIGFLALAQGVRVVEREGTETRWRFLLEGGA